MTRRGFVPIKRCSSVTCAMRGDMRIGFDVRMIQHTGIGRYIECLLPELIRQAPDDEFVLFGDPEKLMDVASPRNVKTVKWMAPIYSITEQVLTPHNDVDVLHVPHFNIPLFSNKKMVVTIHDLIYLLFSESVALPLAKHYASFMISSALKKAGRIISVSGHTKNDLLKIFGEKYSDKIDVIHEASGDDFYEIKDKTQLADVQTRHRLSEHIILYVGSVKPHKNVSTLIEVFKLLKQWGLPHQLVICGKWDKKEDHLREKMLDKDIKYLGEVSPKDLVVLYSMADVLVHLSLYEGFGLTVLEAMHCATPVVVSDSSSLPEVVGESAFVVSPHNVGQIADTVYNVLVNHELSEGMVEAGLENVKRFSWERAAKKTLEAYRSI